MIRSIRAALALAALSTAAACGRGSDQSALQTDSALARDLSAASQVRAAPLDTVSRLEQGYGPAGAPPVAYAPTPGPTRASAAAPTRTRTASSGTRRSSQSSSGSARGSSAGEVERAPAPREERTVTVKHTKRDAAIGAAAGAIIGATTSRDKVKGGIIGGAAGAILGGVIGNNVDKKTRRVP